MGLYITLSQRHHAAAGSLVGCLAPEEVEQVRSTLRRHFAIDAWSPEAGALLLLGGAIAMREDGARAGWDTIADWLGIDRPGPYLEERARDAMREAEDRFHWRVSRADDGRRLYIVTMFRDSGQLWRLLRRTLEDQGNADAHWGPHLAWTQGDWEDALHPHGYAAEVRGALAERLVDLCAGRGLLADLQIVHATLEDTWAGAVSAGVDLREVLGVQNDDEVRVLLPLLFRFRPERAVGPVAAVSDVARWGVVRRQGGLAVAVRLAERLPANGLETAENQVRISDPSRPRWNDLGERADIVATYRRDDDGWTLVGDPTWIEVSTDGLRVAARGSEPCFPLPKFPRWGFLVRDTGVGDCLPALATPRLGEHCALVTAPDTEVEGLVVPPHTLEGGWVSRRFCPTAALAYTVTAEGLSVSVECGRAPVPCPLVLSGPSLGGRGLVGAEGRLRIGGRTVFLGMPRVTGRSAAIRRVPPIVRHAASAEGERGIVAKWELGTLRVADARSGAWTIEEPGGRWRARFHVLAEEDVPKTNWTSSGVTLSLPEEAGWTGGNGCARGTTFDVSLPTEDAGPTAVAAAIPGRPDFQWSLEGRGAEIALLDAAGSPCDAPNIARSDLGSGRVLRFRGPAGGRVDFRVAERTVAERNLPASGELRERAGLLFRSLFEAFDQGYDRLTVTMSVAGTDAVRTFTLFDDTADRPVGNLRDIRRIQDEDGLDRLQLCADVIMERPQVGMIKLGANFPRVMWCDAERPAEYLTPPLELPPGTYAVALRGDRALPNGDHAHGAQTRVERFVVEGRPAGMNPTALAERLKAQDHDGLDLSAPRRGLAAVADELYQLARVAQFLGDARASFVKNIVGLPAAAPRLAWWVARARAGLDEDPRIDDAVLDTLEQLLVDVGWHPSWIRYPALLLLLPPWPRGGWPEWEAGARHAAGRIAQIHPNLETPLQSVLGREVAIHLAQYDAQWPRARALVRPSAPAGRPVNAELTTAWLQRARQLVARHERDPRLRFLDGALRAAVAINDGADALLARKVLLEAVALRDFAERPSAAQIGELADLLQWTLHIEEEPELAARARAWERALLSGFPFTNT